MPRRIFAKTVTVKGCACGQAFSAVATETEGWKVKCPGCGAEHVRDPNVSSAPDGAPIKSKWSIMYGCDPSEVRLLKKLVGPDLEACVKDSGDVRFQNPEQAKAFAQAMERAKMNNQIEPGHYLSEHGKRRMQRIEAEHAARKPRRLRMQPA